jgi:membrane fusion protein, multidrug efflux system
VCPTIACVSFTNNQFPIGGLFSTASFRLSVAPATGAQFSVLPPENATGNFTKIVQRVAVRIVLDDEEATLGQLRPGLSVTARVNVGKGNTGSSERAGL